jgi:MarR family transcriptional regulator for hemolysin
MLDLQPITLTRLLDGLCDNGVIERRSDPADRRAKRLFLTPAARPLLQQLAELGEELMDSALGGLSAEKAAALLKSLTAVKENLRSAAQKKQASPDQRYG